MKVCYRSIFKYSERKDIYNLYHLLNHYNQFGGHYLEQSQKAYQSDPLLLASLTNTAC
ncbi:fructosamine kinase family protein [Vibrio sinaloensis]|nr:fructosamine kinase family protein [Vibrio sinaloensis]